MFLTPFTSLTWAYQLHYYICFRTHRRREFFGPAQRTEALTALIAEIARNHDYHLLRQKVYPTQLRSLVSRQPSQSIAKTVQTLKSNSSRDFARRFNLSVPIWARGYLARSSGHVRVSVVRSYLEKQAAHHGYDRRVLPPVYKYRETKPVVLSSAHTSFDLKHHLVFSTQHRKGVFTSNCARALTDYWLKVAATRNFALDQISIVPDHIHLIVRIVPKMSIEDVALLLLNNGQYFMAKHYPELLISN